MRKFCLRQSHLPPKSAAEWRQWSDRSAMSSCKTLSPSGPMSYLHCHHQVQWATCTAWHWGSRPHPEGEICWYGHITWNTPKMRSRQPVTYRLMKSVGLGGPRWHGSSWQRGIAEWKLSAVTPTWQTHLEIWCEICHACSKPATWKGAHWCGCCPCIYWLIKSPMMMIPYYVYHKHWDCKPEQIAETQIKLIIKELLCWKCQHLHVFQIWYPINFPVLWSVR